MMVRRVLAACCAAFLLAMGGPPAYATHHGPDVWGDDRDDTFRGDLGDEDSTDGPAPPDLPEGTPGEPPERCSVRIGTGSVPVSCPPGCDEPENPFRSIFDPPADPRPCGPRISIDAVRAQVVAAVRHRVPRLQPQRQPASGAALLRIPVVFATGQPGGARTWHDTLLGVAVTTTVTPTWQWRFGDGATLSTQEPGGPWPDTSVSHTFDEAGSFRVAVMTTWDGTFTVEGIGTFPIGGDVTQETSLPLRVVAARAVLVPR